MYADAGYSQDDFETRFSKNVPVQIPLESEKYLLAKNGDVIVGFCYVEKEADKNVLHALYVLPQFQHQGIATKLWNSIREFLDSNKPMILEVLSSNAKAIKFYKKLGFVDTGKRFTDERFKSKSGLLLESTEMVLN
jgi:ribosomal protein S18 acetylase RimI-like enzyme